MNGTMMQYFEWYLPADGKLWQQVAEDAEHLREMGVTSVWLPPAYKGADGINDVGYSPYDLYDLGEFDQKDSVATKYGTLEDYLKAIATLHDKDIAVYADIVLDHLMGGDETEPVVAKEDNEENRNESVSGPMCIEAWTKFTYPGRGKKYSSFRWDWTKFSGTDWDEYRKEQAIFRFKGKSWSDDVDTEHGNFDYLMGTAIDLNNPAVVEELIRWGKWYVKKTEIDGFRLDAVKHIDFRFYNEWLGQIRQDIGEEFFAVGEYWSGDLEDLQTYMDTSGGVMSLFDVPLHFAFFNIAKMGQEYDLRGLSPASYTAQDAVHAVTFVDNHDSQPGQSLDSFVGDWFKGQAYAYILTRQEGYPCIFYGDYYGIPQSDYAGHRELLDKLLFARKYLAYGTQRDYFETANTIGWIREGIDEFPGSGIAVLISCGQGASLHMELGERNANREYYDLIGAHPEHITTDDQGNADFFVSDGSLAVWVPVGVEDDGFELQQMVAE